MRQKYIMAGVVVLALIIAAGLWYALGRHRAPVTANGVVMVMTQRGGLCASGGAGATCESSYRIFQDGRFERHKNFSANEMAELKGIIARTNFTTYLPSDNPTCPSFADGVDLALSFPAKHPGKQFTLCLLDIPQDDTGFRAIVTLLDKHAAK